MEDIGYDLKSSPELAVNESSFRKKRTKEMLRLAETHKPNVKSVYIDGKIYSTLSSKSNSTNGQTEVTKVEHYVVCDGETGDYLREFVPRSGSAKNVAGLHVFLTKRVRKHLDQGLID